MFYIGDKLHIGVMLFIDSALWINEKVQREKWRR